MKTAIEWLANNLKQNHGIDLTLYSEFEQAKEMEKERIMKHSLELAKILISNPYETSGKMPTELIDSYIKQTFKSE